MKLEVGMYVRTKKGSIAKILGIDIFEEGKGLDISNLEAVYFDNIVNDISKDIYRGCFNEVFREAKASYNIIDLIEIGDYVNNSVVVKDSNGKLFVHNTGLIYDNNMYIPLENITIRSIVTKEQFEAIGYEVKKDE